MVDDRSLVIQNRATANWLVFGRDHDDLSSVFFAPRRLGERLFSTFAPLRETLFPVARFFARSMACG
jgi:hypothetical protein